MQFLLTAATEKEIAPAIHYLSAIGASDSLNAWKVLITGVGMMSCTYELTKEIILRRPSFVIAAGIAGSFAGIADIGNSFLVKEDIPGDLGVRESGAFVDLFDMGFLDHRIPYNENRMLAAPNVPDIEPALPRVRAVTINEVTTAPERIRELEIKYAPRLETMEGAAIHYACLKESVPFVHLRAVSNVVGERNKSRWKFNEAIQNLNDTAIRIIERINEMDKTTIHHFQQKLLLS